MGDLANSYHTAFNNQLNAKKAYINSYLDGINARNAVNQEARTQDQYYNYTQPLQASNLGVTVGQNNILQRILDDKNYQDDYFGVVTSKEKMANKLATSDIDNLANYIETQKQNSTTGLNNSKIAALGSSEALSLLPMSQKLTRNELVAKLGIQPKELELAKITAEQNLENAKNKTTTQMFGENPNGTPATIMLPNGGTPSIDKLWTSKYLNPKATTPASGLPSNPSNTQQTGQTQNSNENEYAKSIQSDIDKYNNDIRLAQQGLDAANKYGLKDRANEYIAQIRFAKNQRDALINSSFARVASHPLNWLSQRFGKTPAEKAFEAEISQIK